MHVLLGIFDLWAEFSAWDAIMGVIVQLVEFKNNAIQ